jgi:hypothetical protein
VYRRSLDLLSSLSALDVSSKTMLSYFSRDTLGEAVSASN